MAFSRFPCHKKLFQIYGHTVINGQYVRYPNHVRVCYLLLGWWYLALAACSHKRTGKPRKKETYMSKTLSRKGIAFGAMIALGASLFAGAPASANASGPLTLLPNGAGGAGATYTSLIGAGLTLSSTLDANLQEPASVDGNFIPMDQYGVTAAEHAAFIAGSSDTANDAGDIAYQALTRAPDTFDVDGDPDAKEWPSTWVYSGIGTANYGFVNDPAVDPLADAMYLIENPDEHIIKITTVSADQGYYIYNTAGTAGGPDANDGVFDAGVLSTDDIGCFTTPTSNTHAVCATDDADFTAGSYNATGTFVDYSSGVYVTNAKKIAVRATATGGSAGAETVANVKIDAWDNDQTSAIEVDVTSFTDFFETGATQIGKINNGEHRSATQTVTLLSAAAVPVTTSMKASTTVRGGDEIDATVTIGSSVNPYAVASSLKVLFYEDGVKVNLDADGTAPTTTDAVTAPTGAEVIVPTANAVTGVITATGSRDGALISAVYTARAFFSGTSEDITVGARSAALDLRDGTNSTVQSAKTKFTKSNDVAITAGNDALVRAGTKSLVVTGQITKDTAVGNATQIDYKAAGVRVQATVTGVVVNEDAGSEITVTGSTAEIVEAGDSIVVFGFTDSNGQFPITINSTTGQNLDQVNVQFKALMSADGTYAGVAAETVTWQTAALAEELKMAPSAFLTGETINVTFTAVDQFGVGMDQNSVGRISIRVDAYVDGAVKTSTYSETKATTNGAASFSFANFATSGSDQEIRVQTLNASATAYTAYYTVYNNVATSSIAIADGFENRVQYVDYVTGDTSDAAVAKAATDAGVIAAFTTGAANTEFANIVGTALDANNAGQPGVPVTIAAEGVLFHDLETETIAKDSITVFANGQGFFDVQALSQKVNAAGATVTITAGGVTKTTLLKSYLANSISSANLKFSWVLPATIVKDTTYSVAATLTDVWGNPIRTLDTTGDVNFYGEGALQVNGEADVDRNFNVNGQATFFIRSVATIGGPGTLGAALDASVLYATGKAATTGTVTDTATTTTTDVTTTSWDERLWSGALAVTVDVLDKAPAPTGKVNVGSFNGKLVVYALGLDGAKISWKVAGRWGVATASGDNLNRFDRPVGASGVNVNVEIYVNGVKQLTKTVLTR